MRAAWLIAPLLIAAASHPRTSSLHADSQAMPADSSAVAIEMRDVHLRVSDDIALDIRFLRGRLESRPPESLPVFDNGRSYDIILELGEISVDEPSVNALVKRALGRGHSSISDIRVTFDGGLVKQTGKLRQGVQVPFSIRSRLEATRDGRIRLSPVSVKAAGIPVSGIMKLFDVELEELLEVAPGFGVQADDNEVLLSPGRILPPPEIRGPLAAVAVRGKRLVQVFGSASRVAAAMTERHAPGHYIQFRGNRIRFGRLTMSDTDMRLIDADPTDPFDFYPAQYVAQLVAGYSKNTPRGALRVYMPDYGDLARRRVNLRPRVSAASRR
jgi:hypothetical protein